MPRRRVGSKRNARAPRRNKAPLYEPPHVVDDETIYAPGQLDRLDALLAAGDREGMVSAFFTEVVGVPPEHMTMVRSSPAWPGRVAAAHTIVRECRAEEAYRLPLDRLRHLTIPVLLLLGGDSPPFFGRVRGALEAVLPNIRTVVMPGQQHMAMDTGPDLVLAAVLDFRRDIARSSDDQDRASISSPTHRPP